MRQLIKKESRKLFKEYKRRDLEIVLLLENIQYARNVASIFRTADAAGVRKIYLSGISIRPPFGKELSQASRQKEKSMPWEYDEDTAKLIAKLKRDGFYLVALEITDEGVEFQNLAQLTKGKNKICILAGNEVYGVINKTLEQCDSSIFIPMYGRGASLNVSTSVAIALYAL